MRDPITPSPHGPSMSAREDAIQTPARTGRRPAPLVVATLAGFATGLAVALVLAPESLPLFRARVAWTGPAPAASEWPEPARAGESARVVRVPGGHELEVRTPRAPRARRIAAALAARRAGGIDALESARASLLEAWGSQVEPAPLPPFTPAAECASFLLADAQRRRDLAHALPMPYAAGLAAGPVGRDPAVARAEEALAASLRAADPAACRNALVVLAAAEDARFARGVPVPGAPAPERGAAWRRAQVERADALEVLAARALEDQTPFQNELAEAGAPERVVRLAAAMGDPYAPLVAAASPPPVELGPLPGPWARLLLLGGGLGALVALLAAWLGLRGRPVRAPGRAPFVPARDPAEAAPWLHVVAGPSPVAAVRAALELAAHALARRERVLVVDAGGTKLHERLRRDSRWGLEECLHGAMPVLGLVQYAGRPGFYLLARGRSSRAATWAGLGRCLDEARQHFGRVIVVVDRTTPREFGDSVAGRPLEGWWAAPVGRLPERAIELTTRLGIAFSGIGLKQVPEVSLEVLGARVAALAATLPIAAEPPEQVVAEPAPLPVPPPLPEPIVLDCDLQVRQRLRFLAWMRRVQSESRQGSPRAASH